MASSKIPEAIREQVTQRANGFCEYCHTSEQWQYVRFTVDHVIPLTQGGLDVVENLALACFHCNRKKGTKTTAQDPELKQEVFLFNPRQQVWREHFIWSSDRLLILGLTPTGRATVITLEMNRQRILNIRAADLLIGRHPPANDPTQRPKEQES